MFARAFAIWSSATPALKFAQTDFTNADIKIGFYSGEHGCGPRQAFDGRGLKLAHAFIPPNGDIHFDDAEDWSGTSNRSVSLFWTALHEIGHSLGFAHSADDRSIMFPYYQDHGKNFELPDVDKAGVRYFYSKFLSKVLFWFLYSHDLCSILGDIGNTIDQLPAVTQNSVDDETTLSPGNENPVDDIYPCHSNIDAISTIRGEIFIIKNNVIIPTVRKSNVT